MLVEAGYDLAKSFSPARIGTFSQFSLRGRGELKYRE
jgi:hypothetical protein